MVSSDIVNHLVAIDRAYVFQERFTLLRRLDVSHTRITGVGVKKVVQNLKASLVHLAVNQCMELSIDAVEWAKKQGIQVDFRSQEHLTSARKVRPAY